jgi:hypothetical protein
VKGATIHLHRCLLWVYFLFRCWRYNNL